MKAIVCKSFGSILNLQFSDMDKPIPAKDEVLIKVDYCGVNFPDTLIVEGKYQFQPEFPFAPGGEVTGEVVGMGVDVSDLKQGDMVLAAMGWGGFAEYAVAKASNAFAIPHGVDHKEAAALLETYATAIYGLHNRANLQKAETLCVLGAAGGTGTAAVQLGKLLGARVIACVSSEEKARFAKANGADEVIDYTKDDLKSSLKDLGGCDVVFDPVGGENAEKAFRGLKPNGRHLVVGFASGNIPKLPWNLPLLKSASIVGVFWGHFWRNNAAENRKNVAQLLQWLAEGKIKPNITQEYKLEAGAQALLCIAERRVKGKIVLEV
ncbi:MAG: NADPH:quinone oxidoreductase family protein [Cyclobacteriaceae bacterium]